MDPDCDPGLQALMTAKYSGTEHFETVQLFKNRVQRIKETPVARDDRETWDANVLAGFLDGQLCEEEQNAWETRLETSDALLAELLDVYRIVNRSLVSPAQTPWKCRERVYALDSSAKSDVDQTEKIPEKTMERIVGRIVEKTPQIPPTPVRASVRADREKMSPTFSKASALQTQDIPQPQHPPVPPVPPLQTLPMNDSPAKKSLSNSTQMEKKPRVQDSLDEWKTDRHNRLKYVAALSFFLAVGVLIWNHRDDVRSYWNSDVSESQTIAEDFVDPDSPAFAQDSSEPFFYTQMESPETVIKKADPAPPRTRNYDNIQSVSYLNEKN